ncbi:MAG: PilN domain-containing protein [Synergistes sp.]|nr:PilN domain-containing protein [Synergistes sp.]
MVVKLDLRINKQNEASVSVSGGKSRHYYVLFAVGALFLLSSLLIFSRGIWRSYELRSEKTAFESQAEKNLEKTAVIDAEFKRLEAQNKDASEKLDFVLSGAPVIEFLYELGERTPDGVVIESLSMSPESAVLKGVAFADEEVLELVEALSSAGSVASIAMPVINGGQREGISLRQFSMELKLNPLQQIANGGEGADEAAENGGAPAQNEND